MNMTISDVLDMFCFPEDQLFAVYDYDKDDEIFRGDLYDADDEILELTVSSIDNIYKWGFDGYIVFNVDTANEF